MRSEEEIRGMLKTYRFLKKALVRENPMFKAYEAITDSTISVFEWCLGERE